MYPIWLRTDRHRETNCISFLARYASVLSRLLQQVSQSITIRPDGWSYLGSNPQPDRPRSNSRASPKPVPVPDPYSATVARRYRTETRREWKNVLINCRILWDA